MATEAGRLPADRQALLDAYLRGMADRTAPRPEGPTRRASTDPGVLSPGQQQLWLLAQLAPDTLVYNECVTVHLPGPLAVAALERAFGEILRRHEAWRTTFPTVDGEPVAVVHPAPERPSALPLVDLRALPLAEREGEALRLATEEANVPFDLARGPLLRATLVRLGDEEHRLYLALHHIIFDGVSIYRVFLPELRALYDAYVAGRPSPLPDLPIGYADYAAWQRSPARAAELADGLAYWRRQLADLPDTLALPADRPRPPIQSFRGSMRPFALSKSLSDALKSLAGREGVTLYIVLLAAFATLLHRYSGQDDIPVGTAVAGRARPELQGLLGFFLNTVVMRASLAGDPTFRDLLRRVRDVALDAYAHQDVPFEEVVRALRPERDLARNPLFQVLLTLEPPLPALPSGWTLTQMDVETHISKFDLSLELDDRPEGLIGRFEYSTDLFDAATIERMVGHWTTLLEGIVADPARRLSDLPLLTAAERRTLLDDWSRPGPVHVADHGHGSRDAMGASPLQTTLPHVAPRDGACLHELVEARARRTPDAVAVECAGERLTYRALDEKANGLAHLLAARGVGPDTLVGLYLDRSPDTVVALLGILKAGGAYVPLDPAYPPARLATMLEDAAAPVLVTSGALRGRLPAHGATVVEVDGVALRADAPRVAVAPAHLAYVIYTSGSTGRPKGVQIPHRAIVNLLGAMRERPGLAAGDTLLAVTTLSFDIAALEIFLPLVVGARVVIASRAVAADGVRLAAALDSSGATMMQATPATWRLLLAAGWPGSARLTALCGGEALSPELAAALLPRCKRLWNMYGPTETTVWSTVQRVDRADGPIPIGRPIANTDVYILDRALNPVPVGVPGELHIGGAGLARGYRDRPDLTARSFIPHPFSREPGARLYKTGDLARYRPDGTVECLGRLDHQVKVRGYRIEPGEIEAALREHPAVREALVVARADASGEAGEARLVAYVIPREGQPVAPDELRAFLAARLPAYMVPSAHVLLDGWPLTPNGKVDRSALPALGAAHVARAPFAPPRTPLERRLAALWEELLGVSPIGVDDNFFHLGGHSLLAARLVDRVARECGRRLPLATLFAAPTIEGLARALTDDEKGAVDEGSPLVRYNAEGSLRSFFYLHGAIGGGGFYVAELARALGPDQPLCALHPHGYDGRPVPRTIEEMADDLLPVVRAAQPEGPYLLGGYCNGGIVAYELARRLRAAGERVDLLVMVDTMREDLRYAWLHRAAMRRGALAGLSAEAALEGSLRLRSRVARAHHDAVRLRYIARRSPREQLNWAASRVRGVIGRYRRRPVAQDGRGDAPAPVSQAQLVADYEWAMRRYVPPPYPGRVTLLWPSLESVDHRDALIPNWRAVTTAEWRRVAGEVDIATVQGSHLSIVGIHVRSLAGELAALVRRAHEES